MLHQEFQFVTDPQAIGGMNFCPKCETEESVVAACANLAHMTPKEFTELCNKKWHP